MFYKACVCACVSVCRLTKKFSRKLAGWCILMLGRFDEILKNIGLHTSQKPVQNLAYAKNLTK